jgi:epoxyqueuosine reductase
MSLKAEFFKFVNDEFDNTVAGIAPCDDFSERELSGMKSLISYFSKLTMLPDDMKVPKQPRELLGDMKSIIVVASSNYMERPKGFDFCRSELLGTASPIHVTPDLMLKAKERSMKICTYFSDRGLRCKPVAASLIFPLKIMAVRAGIGYYGKNSMVINPGFGSWLAFSAFFTEADLETDQPLDKSCNDCDRCIRECPSGALSSPYSCDVSKCINFHLPHNKQDVPREIRLQCRNFIGSACSVCRDVCPENNKLLPVPGLMAEPDLLHPKLLEIIELDDVSWKKGYARNLTGMTMRSKKYLQRNAAIALGNFKDERAVEKLSKVLIDGADEVRGYAAWALGRIETNEAVSLLEQAFEKEADPDIKVEISLALKMS